MANSLPHILSRVFNTPLAILPAKMDTIIAVLMPKLNGGMLDALDTPERTAAPQYAVVQHVAVIPIMGTLVQRASGVDALSGLTAYGQVESALNAALADPNVSALLLDFDSPGGEVPGMVGLADKIYAARGSKPIWSYANEMAASAAYALAAATDHIVVGKTSLVGSIGVLAEHVDQSALDAKEGLVYTPVYAGAHKVDGDPHRPLDEQGRATLQGLVDAAYEVFASSVAEYRGMTLAAVKATEARVYNGGSAVAAGLADEVGTFDSVVTALSVGASGKSQSGLTRKENRMASLWDKFQAALKATPAPADWDNDEDDLLADAGEVITISGSTVVNSANTNALLTKQAELQARIDLINQERTVDGVRSCLREAMAFTDNKLGVEHAFFSNVRGPMIVALAQALSDDRGYGALFEEGEQDDETLLIENHPNGVRVALTTVTPTRASSLRHLLNAMAANEAGSPRELLKQSVMVRPLAADGRQQRSDEDRESYRRNAHLTELGRKAAKLRAEREKEEL